MENTPRLYNTLLQMLSQHRKWLDVRHLKTLAWMMVGLIETGLISLTQWAPFVHGRATFAQSSVRRFARWLDNERTMCTSCTVRSSSRRWRVGVAIPCI